MRLSFDQGYFILDVERGIHADKPAPREWEKIDARTFRTNDLRVAKVYRAHADLKAERIFAKVFLKRYQAPDLSRLDFLDPHQIDGVRHILTRSRSYLAHAPGAGKTAQAICAATLTDLEAPSLFIVPPSLTANWGHEIEKVGKWLGLSPDFSTIGTSAQRDDVNWKASFIICPDSMLTASWVLEELAKIKFKFLAVDEASRFKEPLAKRTIALFGGAAQGFKARGLIYGPKHVVLMDGSPMPNRPMELWAPTFAMVPEAIDFMPRQDFGMRYCGPTRNDFGGFEFNHSSNEDELKEKLQKDFMHVVHENALNHPERRRSILFMSEDPRTAAHKRWDKANLKGLDVGALDDDIKDTQLANWRHELGVRKVSWAVKYINERLKDKNESILVFAWHRDVCLELFASLPEKTTGLVIGGTPANVREHFFKRFQDGKLNCIVGNIAAMGRGHNLQRADRVIFVEPSWCGETNIQAEKRASRRGSTKEFIRVEYICAPGSVDEIVLASIFSKDRSVKKVIG